MSRVFNVYHAMIMFLLATTCCLQLFCVRPSTSFQVVWPLWTRRDSRTSSETASTVFAAHEVTRIWQTPRNYYDDLDQIEKGVPLERMTTTCTSTRRDWFVSSSSKLLLMLLATGTCPEVGVSGRTRVWASDVTTLKWGATPDRPVAILGGGGRTGMEVARALAKQGIYAMTMTRTGKDPFHVIKLPPEVKMYLNHFPNPVTVVDSVGLQHSLKAAGASAIIFCASASPQGGTAFQVDDEGVGNAALAAKALGARLIVVSALAVDRPDSKSFKMTNTLGGTFNGIMDAKRQGEQQVRDTLSKSGKDYVIIRPGPLMSGKTYTGIAGLQLNQGDTIGGGISRDELAGVVVGALLSGTKGATVEVYRTLTATALQKEFPIPSGNESKPSDTYIGLFEAVRADE
jgi:uncharacterized protein YbjT (DUF2867 family)